MVATVISGFEKMVRLDESLASHTWFRFGGPAQYFVQPHGVDALSAFVRRCHDEGLPVRLLGGGSNLLIRDAGVKGVVLKLSDPIFSDIQIGSGRVLTAGGGARLGHVISTAVKAGLAGLEPLVGIPGTIGGALHANAGSRGGDIGQWTCSATVMTRTGEILQRSRDDLVFAYRESSLDELVILSAQFQLEAGDPEELTKRLQKQWILMKAAQPLSHQHTGCIFQNPRGMSASMLIEQAGLKGASVGGAVVSDRHANFIVAEDNATSDDVLRLIDLIRTRVAERMGVELDTQIEIW